MALGDGIRRNIAHVTAAERTRFRDAIVALNSRYYPDGVSKWVKQDQIHEATHVHGGPAFLPWHRELCNRFEQLIREIDPDLSLHYWDWTEDPRAASDGAGGTVNLFTEDFMGASTGGVGAPFSGFPAISRDVANGAAAPAATGVDSDDTIIASADGLQQADQYQTLRETIEQAHNHDSIHGYIGGTIGDPHTAFEDPFVFLIHSNVDRLWAMWQTVAGEEWRLDPELTYGNEASDTDIVTDMEPWAGASGLRPWAPPDNQQVAKNCKHPSVVAPPCYDSLPTFVPLFEVVNPGNVINFNSVPEGETAARAASFRLYGCHEVEIRVKSGTEPTAPFSILTPGASVTVPHEHGEFTEARIWFGFTGQTPGTSEPSQIVTIEVVGTTLEFDFTLTADSIAREEVAVVLALDQSGSMDEDAGTTGHTRMELLKEAATEFVNLIQANNGVGLIRFDHDAYEVGDATYPGFPVTRITTDDDFDGDRLAARAAVAAHATNTAGRTSIGDGVAMARDTIDPVSGYDRKAMIVFTDGLENEPATIESVMSSIDDRTFAIGLGNAQQVSTAALSALTAGTGGYLLLTDSLTSSLDDYFLLRKYFLQILASVTNTDIIVDPNGYLGPGVRLRIPFDVDAADMICTPFVMHELPIVRFAVEAPNGKLITPGTIAATGGTFGSTDRMSYYRFLLPAVAGGEAVHAGRWYVVLELDRKRLRGKRGQRSPLIALGAQGKAHGIRYSVNVHMYSNLRMHVQVVQTSLEPGATIGLRVRLLEYGIPVENRSRVRAQMRRPDGSELEFDLTESEPGLFTAERAEQLSGVYRFRVLGSGITLRGHRFTREQTVTGALLRGGDGPFPFGGNDPQGNRRKLCELVECWSRSGVFKDAAARMGVDCEGFLRCVRKVLCESRPERRPRPKSAAGVRRSRQPIRRSRRRG